MSPPVPVAEPGLQAEPDRVHEVVPEPPVADAPLPTEADGVVEKGKPKGRWRVVPRAVLFVPRYALDIALHPVRMGLIAFDKYALAERIEDIVFNDARTFGIWPVLFVETGFGANGGLRLLHRNLFGHGERLRLRAGWGGIDRQIYSATLDTGHLLGDQARISFGGTFRISPSLWFFGIGDHDLDDAVATRYRRDIALGSMRVRLSMSRHTVFEFGHTLKWARFSPPDGDAIAPIDAYDPATVVGWERHPLDAYLETAVAYDDLRTTADYISAATPSTGWRLRAYGGFTEGLLDSPSHYGATGIDVQRFFDLYAGTRVLIVRAQLDHVFGRRDRIPFEDYPALGGPQFLRGYLRGRFRDRFSTLLNVEYVYPIFARASGFLFVDAGRVWSDLLAVRARVPHFGFGGGIQIHTPKSYLMRLQLAGSPEGFFVNFHFNPTSRVRDRLSP